MRWINVIFHLVVVLLLYAGLDLHAQTQGTAPFPVDAYASGLQMNGGTGACAGNAGCVNLLEGVAAQDLIVCGASQEHIAGPGIGCATGSPQGNDPPWTFSDTASFTWNMQTATNVFPTGAQFQMGYACATSTQATYRVSWTGVGAVCQSSFQCTRFKNACSGGTVTSEGLTGSVSAASGGVTTTSHNLTTTATNDLIVSFGAHQNATGGGTSIVSNNTPPLAMTVNDTGMSQTTFWEIAQTLGSNSLGFAGLGGNASQQIVTQSLGFKIPIKLTDTAIPQGAIGVVYKAQLHCYGSAIASPTYALASGSLPAGLTLHTTTGIIDGTPTGSPSTNTPGFTCTDGTLTSSIDTMTLKVGASFNGISIGPVSSGNLSLVPAQFTLAVGCGDMILVFATADDTHNGQGYLQPINGLSGFVSDSLGSPVQAFLVNGGINRAPMVAWVLGPVPIGGTDAITATNGTASSSGLHYYAYDIKGAQSVLDVNAMNSIGASSNGSISATYVTQVANELLLVLTATTNGTATITFSAPLSLDLQQSSPETFTTGHAFISTASTVTATSNITEPTAGCSGLNFCDSWSTLVAAFRPGLPLACNFIGAGEKKRRSMN